MKKSIFIIFVSFAAFAMACSDRKTFNKDQILNDIKMVADYELLHPSLHDYDLKYDFKNGWVPATFYMGLIPLYEATGDTKYLQAVKKWGDSFDWECAPRQHHADDIVCGQVFLDLYRHERNPVYVEKLIERMDSIVILADSGRKEWSWCDALFMAPPTYVMASKILENPVYLIFADTMYWDVHDYLYDKQNALFFRDESYFAQKSPNGEKMFWGRGNGWVLGGLAKMIPYIEDKDLKGKYVVLYREMAERIASLQQKDGLWRSNLLDPEHYPQKETSGTAFYVYSLAWGINYGLLNETTYLPIVEKGWLALTKSINRNTGMLGYVQPIGAEPGETDKNISMSYGAGAFVLAGIEMLKLKNNRYFE